MMTYVETGTVPDISGPKLQEEVIREYAAKLVSSLPIDKLKRLVEVTVRDPNNRKQFENAFERQRLDMLADRKQIEIIVKLTI